MSILDEIFAHKRGELAQRKQDHPLHEVEALAQRAPLPPNMIAALRDSAKRAPRLIAEVKHRSPSKGLLCPDFDPDSLATTYAANGAAAISVLTDEKYFGGKLEYLADITTALGKTHIPLLRKDFLFEPYQLAEARAYGASAALLIVAMLEHAQLAELIATANAYALTPLVEVHTRTELDIALNAGAMLIGINNRDLHTFTVDLRTTLDLLPHIPDEVTIVAESGIRTNEDVRQLADAGVHAMLIGETLVTAPDRAAAVRRLSQMQ